MLYGVSEVNRANLESVFTVAIGVSSALSVFPLWRSKSQSSRCVVFEKSASTAPATVPVANNGAWFPGDQAKVAVRGIRKLTMTPLKSGLYSLFDSFQKCTKTSSKIDDRYMTDVDNG